MGLVIRRMNVWVRWVGRRRGRTFLLSFFLGGGREMTVLCNECIWFILAGSGRTRGIVIVCLLVSVCS